MAALRGEDLRIQLSEINFKNLPKLNQADEILLRAVIQGEMSSLCTKLQFKVPEEPAEQVSVGNKDGSNNIDLSAQNNVIETRVNRNTSQSIKGLIDNIQKINEGTFGTCNECGENIKIDRIFNSRLTATLCIECKELEEKSLPRNILRTR